MKKICTICNIEKDTNNGFQKCWALFNLRPLIAKQNVIEGPARIRHKRAA